MRPFSLAAGWAKRYGPTDFVVDGAPQSDWPARANVAVPLAVVVQAGVWISMWWALYALARTIGFLPFYFIALIVGASVAVLPADAVIRWARFRNFNRWVGLAIVILGIVLAKIVSASVALIPGIEPVRGASACPRAFDPTDRRLPQRHDVVLVGHRRLALAQRVTRRHREAGHATVTGRTYSKRFTQILRSFAAY